MDDFKEKLEKLIEQKDQLRQKFIKPKIPLEDEEAERLKQIGRDYLKPCVLENIQWQIICKAQKGIFALNLGNIALPRTVDISFDDPYIMYGLVEALKEKLPNVKVIRYDDDDTLEANNWELGLYMITLRFDTIQIAP